MILARVKGVKTRSIKAKYYESEKEGELLTKNVKMYDRYKIEIITAYKVNYKIKYYQSWKYIPVPSIFQRFPHNNNIIIFYYRL